ncbi:ATP/GTP-binding protein [Phyllobacterium myrsinacearum]|uniref:ATP/GTP-binding protein n=1 Tax=Phyllobacterium myrsinacearum TaxID=28101 RepID=A0A839EM54_9HYPH|nr:ATP/GTP-binding protein [Phyllobacterium myrsinacearum]MBA8877567.1 hypothetical protein [Phyllobacterium myrsinacearum]
MHKSYGIISVFAVVASLFPGPAHAGPAREVWKVSGFKTPESALYDKAHQRLIVSNINGAPDAVDGNGFLSLVSLDGQIIQMDWASGFDAPKGMAIVGNKLFISDITKLRVVDLDTGKIIETLAAEKAVFLNDVTASANGDVFVTDMLADRIYRYSGGKIDLWLESAGLGAPNGIIADGNRLIVGSWGKGVHPDFTTDKPGGLLEVDMATKAVTPFPQATAFANVDGIVVLARSIYLSDPLKGALYRVVAGQAPQLVAQFKPGDVDIGSDDETLYVPMMNEGELFALKINALN